MKALVTYSGELAEVSAPSGYRLAADVHYLTFDRADYRTKREWQRAVSSEAQCGVIECPPECECRG